MRSTARLSGTVAALGVAAVAFLEIAHAPASDTPAQTWSVAAAILIGGLLRWYMFYEGTALGAFNERDARKALAFSVILAVGLFAYGVFLAVVGEFEWHLFALFALVNLGLVFAEWVFGRRTSYTKPARVIELEAVVEQMKEKAGKAAEEIFSLRGQVNGLESRLKEVSARLEGSESNLARLKTRVAECEELLAEQIIEANSLKIYADAAKDAFFVDERGKFKICPCGDKTYMASNNTKTLVCNCGQVLFHKQ